MRIIIRFSIDDGAILYSKLAGHLNFEAEELRKLDPYNKKVFQKTGTATWEGEIPDSDVPKLMATFWQRWTEHAASPANGKIDHIWMYADHPKPEAPSAQ